jgi:peptide-methionine (S)-S-oxide reductase
MHRQWAVIKGVKKVVSGYSGGKRENPNYEQVCTGVSGHAEVVEIEVLEKSGRDWLTRF